MEGPEYLPKSSLVGYTYPRLPVGIVRLRCRKNRKSNSVDYVSKVRQQKIGTSPEILPLKNRRQKSRRGFFTNSSPKVQMGRMSQELRLSSNSEESEREVATSKSPTHPYAPLLTRGQGIKNLPQIEETMRIGTWRTRAVES